MSTTKLRYGINGREFRLSQLSNGRYRVSAECCASGYAYSLQLNREQVEQLQRSGPSFPLTSLSGDDQLFLSRQLSPMGAALVYMDEPVQAYERELGLAISEPVQAILQRMFHAFGQVAQSITVRIPADALHSEVPLAGLERYGSILLENESGGRFCLPFHLSEETGSAECIWTHEGPNLLSLSRSDLRLLCVALFFLFDSPNIQVHTEETSIPEPALVE